MLPALRFVASQSGAVPVREVSSHLADEFSLSEHERKQLLPSGRAPLFYNRVQWAITHMRKAGQFATPRRACVSITQRGLDVLAKTPSRIDLKLLSAYPEFQAFRAKKGQSADETDGSEPNLTRTPLETLEAGYQNLKAELAEELLAKVKTCSPAFFEQLVVELLVKMGYGGSRMDAGKALGKSGDEGIDGIIKEDKLGLDTIYLQAKRWNDNSVGRPAIQQFAGALAGQGAHKGIFITTSTFTNEARAFVTKINSKIVLIDGDQLAELMIDHGVGVATAATYELKRLDSDYFAEGDE